MINFPKLMKCLTINECMPVIMRDWVTNECGTVGCLYGNYRLAQMSHKERNQPFYEIRIFPNPIVHQYSCSDPKGTFGIISREFGITIYEAQWLFGYAVGNEVLYERDLSKVTKKQALSRLRKFIYYKLHKQEMVIEQGRNKQVVHLGRNIAGRKSATLAAETGVLCH